MDDAIKNLPKTLTEMLFARLGFGCTSVRLEPDQAGINLLKTVFKLMDTTAQHSRAHGDDDQLGHGDMHVRQGDIGPSAQTRQGDIDRPGGRYEE